MAVHRLGAGCSCGLGFGEAEVRLHLGQRAAGTGLAVKAIQPQRASAPQTCKAGGEQAPGLHPVQTGGVQLALGSPRSLGQMQPRGSARAPGAELPIVERVCCPRVLPVPVGAAEAAAAEQCQALRPEKSPCVPRSIICSIASPKLFLKPGGSH